MSEEWVEEIRRVTEKTIEVVEMRKSMEKTLEISCLESVHFDTISSLVEQNLELQSQSDELANKLKVMESQHLKNTLESIERQNRVP